VKLLTFAIAGVLAIIGIAFAAPNLSSAALAFLSDPHAHAGVLFAASIAVDPDAVAAELRRIGDGIRPISDKVQELSARMMEVEQRQARRPNAALRGTGDLGGELLAALDASTDLKAVAENRARRAIIDLPPGFFRNAITTDTTSMPQQLPGIVAPAQRRLAVKGLLPSIQVTSGSIQYTQETGFDNQAAPVSETTQKPESSITHELKTANVVTLAHLLKCSLQSLSDTPTLQQHIIRRGVYNLAVVEDQQLLKGSGVGNNISGLVTNATAYSLANSPETFVDTLRRAAEQLELANFSASGIVLHPTDWAEIELLKDSQNRYIVGNPGGATQRRLWDLPVVTTISMTQGRFLVGDFAQAALVLDREQARVDISTENVDDFEKNMATVRVEERIGLAILRPEGLVYGTF